MARSTASLSFADALWPAHEGNRVLRGVVLALLGSGLLTLSAKLQIPFYPVPMTMQTLVALLLGMALGPRLGAATVLLYLAEGAAGLPVFAGTPAKGLGLAYMLGPTGGYLAGFALAAGLAGWVVEKRRDVPGLAAAAVLGVGAIYLPGWLWLSTLVGPSQAFVLGIAPFVLGDALKAALAVVLGLAGRRVIERRRAGHEER